LKCGKIWKIWKKRKLNSEMIWKIAVLVIITSKRPHLPPPLSPTTLLLLA
jgi:hypothetical protein